MQRNYYTINEDMARASQNSNSFREYTLGSATEDYKRMVDLIYDLGDQAIAVGVDSGMIADICNRFAKRYAAHINTGFSIECMCPSVMVCGPANFPVRKKEKQNLRRDRHHEEYERLMSVRNKLINLANRPCIATADCAPPVEIETPYFKVIENVAIMRLQLIFSGKPSVIIRDTLKHNAFKWSPTNGAWQRQLTPNARASVARILKACAEERGE